MTEPLINSQRVTDILRDCLYRPEEITGDAVPEGAIIVEGILRNFGLHPERLESHRAEVTEMLSHLPTQFRDSAHGGDGGWSFLNACQDANDEQWTSFHQTMDALFVLGIGLGLAAWLLPRGMWDALPGGMPYVVVRA
jgi:hypothetical protein